MDKGYPTNVYKAEKPAANATTEVLSSVDPVANATAAAQAQTAGKNATAVAEKENPFDSANVAEQIMALSAGSHPAINVKQNTKELKVALNAYESSQTDKDEDKALNEIASKFTTEEESDKKVLNLIKQEESTHKKIDIKSEIKMLKSGNFDDLM